MDYLGKDIPKLGFGLMRLPVTETGKIDIPQTCKMTDLFLKTATAPLKGLSSRPW